MKSGNDISGVLLPQNPQNDCHISTVSPPSQESRATSAEDASQRPVLGHQKPNVDEAYLALAFDQLNFYEEPLMAERMFLSLGVIIQKAVEGYDLDIDIQRVQDALSRADQSSRHGDRDIEVLGTIQTILDRLLLLDSDHFVEAATILANASRNGRSIADYSPSGLRECQNLGDYLSDSPVSWRCSCVYRRPRVWRIVSSFHVSSSLATRALIRVRITAYAVR